MAPDFYMARSDSVLLAIGGGDITASKDILDEIFGYLDKRDDAHMVIMTIATSEAEEAAKKYNGIFRRRSVSHVSRVDVDDREDAFATASVDKISRADAIFFTGGDQNLIPALLGGTPLHHAINERLDAGIMLIGTSAGAAMMSGSMISGGESKTAPRVGAVKIAPGMNFVPNTIIDTHFSERGRHGRLLTAVAHDPQLLGIGLDESTGILIQGKEMRMVGAGSVTLIDGSRMTYSNLAYRREDDPIAMFHTAVHILPAGYSYSFAERLPRAPKSNSAGEQKLAA